MNILILLPFAVPPVVSSVGLLQLYGSGPFAMVGTPWILIGCYFTVALPFMYRAITNNLQAINLRDLMDAAQLLGASTFQAAFLVVLPNLRKGLMVALLLSFSFLFGEFVFANILVGTRYETLQVYLNNMRNSSGHFTSALVISYFLFVLHLREQIRQIQRELGLTTIFVTHDQEEALTMSDRIFLMNQGKIVQSGDAETLYTAPVDVFAAGFIGNYNLLDADSASKLLQRPIKHRIAIRPEAIELSLDGDLDAQVRSHSLLGNVIRYRIEARGVELVVDVLNRSASDLHPDGQRLALSIDPTALREVA
eukprot:gene7855-7688_t